MVSQGPFHQPFISMIPYVKFVGAKVKLNSYFSLLSTLKGKWYWWCFEWWWVGPNKIFLDAYFFSVSIITQPWKPGVSAGFVFMFMSWIQKFCFLVCLKYKLMLKTQRFFLNCVSFTQQVTGHPSCSCTLTLQALPILVSTRPLGSSSSCCPTQLLKSRAPQDNSGNTNLYGAKHCSSGNNWWSLTTRPLNSSLSH